MTRNDMFLKILFAISLALLPMTIFSYLFLPSWAIYLFVAGLLLAKIWIELFKDKYSFAHTIINAINSVAVFATLFIIFYLKDVINLTLVIIIIIAIVLMQLMKVLLFRHSMPDYVDAIDYCYMLFESLTLIAFIVVLYDSTFLTIASYALLITALVSVIYKVYFAFRYTSLRNIFKKKK